LFTGDADLECHLGYIAAAVVIGVHRFKYSVNQRLGSAASAASVSAPAPRYAGAPRMPRRGPVAPRALWSAGHGAATASARAMLHIIHFAYNIIRVTALNIPV
jgi:hypothetical protein